MKYPKTILVQAQKGGDGSEWLEVGNEKTDNLNDGEVFQYQLMGKKVKKTEVSISDHK